MYDIGPGAAADLGLGRVRFRPAVAIAPPPCVPANLAPPPEVGPLVCRPIWPGPIAKGVSI